MTTMPIAPIIKLAPHTSRKYMTVVTAKSTGERKLAYVATCRDCLWRQISLSAERRDIMAEDHQGQMQLKRHGDIIATIRRLKNHLGSAQEGLDAIVAHQEGYPIDPELNDWLVHLPTLTHLEVAEIKEQGLTWRNIAAVMIHA